MINVNRPKTTGVTVNSPQAKVVEVREFEADQLEIMVQYLDGGKVFTTERYVVPKPAQFDAMMLAVLKQNVPDLADAQ